MGHGIDWFEILERQGSDSRRAYKTLPDARDAVIALFRLGTPIPLQLLPLLGTPIESRP